MSQGAEHELVLRPQKSAVIPNTDGARLGISTNEDAAARRDASGQSISAADLLAALYRTFLGRDPDPVGLRDGLAMLRNGFKIEEVAKWVLLSGEFAAQHKEFIARFVHRQSNAAAGPSFTTSTRTALHDAAAGMAAPRVATLTAEQTQWLGSFVPRPDDVLLARFRLEPGSKPIIYVAEQSRLPHPRGLQSIQYVDALITGYLVNPDYFHLLVSNSAAGNNERFCVVQIDDCADEIGIGIAYCAPGPEPALIPDPHFWATRGYFDLREQFRKSWVPWQDRRPQAFWRGSSTGLLRLTMQTILDLPRFRLCGLAKTQPSLRGKLDARITQIVQAPDPAEAQNIRDLLRTLDLLGAPVPQQTFMNFRFLIDIDGNSNSWGLLLKLLMGSCVLKVSSPWQQWYYDGLRAWEHYVPVSGDLSDLEARIAWCLDNDAEARAIGENGLEYGRRLVFGPEMLAAAKTLLQATRPFTGPN